MGVPNEEYSNCFQKWIDRLERCIQVRVKENRFFAGPDRFIKLKTDLFENFSCKIGPRKFSLWPNFPVNRWKHLVKTDKYLVKCQAVYCPYYVIQLSPVLGPCEVKFDKNTFTRSRQIS